MKLTILSVLGLLLALSLMLAGCNSSTSDTNAPASAPATVSSGITGAAVGLPEESSVEEVPSTEAPLMYNIRTQELKQMASQIDNYEYTYKSTSRADNGVYYQDANFRVLVRDGKMKKVYPMPQYRNSGVYYNEVYLNPLTHTAYGTCTVGSVICREQWEKYFELNYFAETVEDTPSELMAKLDGSSKALGETNYQDRQTTIIQSKLPDGIYEKLWVDNYYGLPLKQVLFEYGSDEEEVVLEEHVYYPLTGGSGTVKLSDINLPANYVEIK